MAFGCAEKNMRVPITKKYPTGEIKAVATDEGGEENPEDDPEGTVY